MVNAEYSGLGSNGNKTHTTRVFNDQAMKVPPFDLEFPKPFLGAPAKQIEQLRVGIFAVQDVCNDPII